MILTILDKFSIKNYSPAREASLIRISSQALSKIDMSKYQEVIEFHFDDVLEETDYSIKDSEGQELIDFISRNKYTSEIVVHCDYGQGRSPAVAIFIAKMLNLPYDFTNCYPNYNSYVLKKLQDLLLFKQN